MCTEFDDIVFTSPSRQKAKLSRRHYQGNRSRSAPAVARFGIEPAATANSQSTTFTAMQRSDAAISEGHYAHSGVDDLEDMFGIVNDEDTCKNTGDAMSYTPLAAHPPLEAATAQELPHCRDKTVEESTSSQSTSNALSNFEKLRHVCLEYSVDQLAAATDRFHASRRLGSGSCGTVFQGKCVDGSHFAVKAITLKDASASGFEEEIMTLSKFRHPNLVVLMGWAQSDSSCFLVYEFLAGGSLQQRLKADLEDIEDAFVWNLRISVACDAATGLAHLHNMRPRAFHRDIKSANILLGCGCAKLGDFGLSCVAKNLHDEDLTCEIPSGTPGYACPIYVKTGKMKEASEIYSFGIVLYEILLNLSPSARVAGKIVFPLHDAIRTVKGDSILRYVELADSKANFPEDVIIKLAELALECTHLEESSRPNFTEVCCRLREILESSLTRDTKSGHDSLAWKELSHSKLPQRKVCIAPGALPPPFALVCIQSCSLSQAQLAQLPTSSRILQASCTQAQLRVGIGSNTEEFWINLIPDSQFRGLIAEEHFEVTLELDCVYFRNLSKSGTHLNGSLVYDKEPLQAGSIIAICGRLAGSDEDLAIVRFRFESGMVQHLSDGTDSFHSSMTTMDTAITPSGTRNSSDKKKPSLPECGASLICCIC